jgi:hypothetical protein
MAEMELFIASIPTYEIFEKLANVLDNSGWKEKPIKIGYNISEGLISGDIQCLGSEFKNNDEFTSILAILKEKPYLSLIHLNVFYSDKTFLKFTPAKEPVASGFNIKLGTANAQHKEVFNRAYPKYRMNTLDVLHSNFTFISKFRLVRENITQEEQALISERENTLAALQNASAKIAVTASEQLEIWNSKIIELEETLTKKYLEKENKLNEGISLEKEKLESEREKFKTEKAKFDERENTVVRRSLLDDIKGIIKQNSEAKVSDDTVAKRKPVKYLCFTLMGVAAVVVGISLYHFYKNADNKLLIQIASATSIIISTFIYYIRWQNQWFKRHADAEFQNKKFETDMLRSSWLVEMLLEWNEKKDKPIPDKLLESLTNNLFEDESPSAQVTHPIEDVIKAASKFKKIKVNKGGIELENKSNDSAP